MTRQKYDLRMEIENHLTPEELDKLINHQTRLIAAHLVKRPSHTDIPALTEWSQEHADLKTKLDFYQGQRRAGWRDVAPPMKPITKEEPAVTTTPREQMQAILAEIQSLTTRAASAFDRAAFRQIYQTIHNRRNKAKDLARKHDLDAPIFPDLPANPFAPAPEPDPATFREQTAEAVQEMAAQVNRKETAVPYEPITSEQLLEEVPELRQVAQPTPVADHLVLTVKVPVTQEIRAMVLEGFKAQLPEWFPLVMEELERARAKWPGADQRTLALAEESGEIVKAVLDLHNGAPGATWEKVQTEIIQTMAMCVRLLEEGDASVLPAEAVA